MSAAAAAKTQRIKLPAINYAADARHLRLIELNKNRTLRRVLFQTAGSDDVIVALCKSSWHRIKSYSASYETGDFWRSEYNMYSYKANHQRHLLRARNMKARILSSSRPSRVEWKASQYWRETVSLFLRGGERPFCASSVRAVNA